MKQTFWEGGDTVDWNAQWRQMANTVQDRPVRGWKLHPYPPIPIQFPLHPHPPPQKSIPSPHGVLSNSRPFQHINCLIHNIAYINTHTHIRLTTLCPGLPRWAGNGEVKPMWILLKQETVSGISWAICNSVAYRSLQIDNHTSTPPLSFLQAGCPSCRPTNSVKALKQQI